jgi:1,4-dihydroxy-2-naphthoate polyprenyltransferase
VEQAGAGGAKGAQGPQKKITFGVVLAAIRPRTLTAAFAPVAVATALAAAHHVAHYPLAAACLLSALLIQIGTNLANDYYDFKKGADTHERVGPQRVTQAGLVAPETVKAWAQLTFGAAALLGLWLSWVGGLPILLVGIFSILSGWAYTGGPYPLGYNGLGDLFVMLFFGFVATLGTYWLQAGQLPWVLWALSVPVGALATAILVANNLRDRVTDAKAGKRTLAVRLGKGAAQAEYVLLLLLTFLTPVALVLGHALRPPALLSLLSLPLAVPPLKLLFTAEGKALIPALGGTARLQLVYAALLSIGLLL